MWPSCATFVVVAFFVADIETTTAKPQGKRRKRLQSRPSKPLDVHQTIYKNAPLHC
jgi:hypothetical protein